MSCEEFTEMLTDYLDGRVPYGRRLGMLMHVAMCSHCRRYLRQMRVTIDLTQDLGAQDTQPSRAPDELKSEVMRAFRERAASHTEQGSES